MDFPSRNPAVELTTTNAAFDISSVVDGETIIHPIMTIRTNARTIWSPYLMRASMEVDMSHLSLLLPLLVAGLVIFQHGWMWSLMSTPQIMQRSVGRTFLP